MKRKWPRPSTSPAHCWKAGAKASEPFLQALRLTPEDVLSAYSATESSSTWYEELRQSTEAKLSGKDQVTLLRAQYELLDLPSCFNFTIRKGKIPSGKIPIWSW